MLMTVLPGKISCNDFAPVGFGIARWNAAPGCARPNADDDGRAFGRFLDGFEDRLAAHHAIDTAVLGGD